MSELNPCPFCGGEAYVSKWCYKVLCIDCDAEVFIERETSDGVKEVSLKWNARADGWISVDDRLPEVGIKVLCYRPEAEKSGDEIIKVSYALDGKNRSPQGIEHKFECWCHVTHWMPLPNPPKTDKQ